MPLFFGVGVGQGWGVVGDFKTATLVSIAYALPVSPEFGPSKVKYRYHLLTRREENRRGEHPERERRTRLELG